MSELVERLARESGDVSTDDRGRKSFEFDDHGIERFAALVAEECVKCGYVLMTPIDGEFLSKRPEEAVEIQTRNAAVREFMNLIRAQFGREG